MFQPEIAHGDALMRPNAERRARFGGAQQNESSVAVGWKITPRAGLIPFASALDAPGARDAPTLQTH